MVTTGGAGACAVIDSWCLVSTVELLGFVPFWVVTELYSCDEPGCHLQQLSHVHIHCLHTISIYLYISYDKR